MDTEWLLKYQNIFFTESKMKTVCSLTFISFTPERGAFFFFPDGKLLINERNTFRFFKPGDIV